MFQPKSFYEWTIPYTNIEFGEKVAESPKGPVHRFVVSILINFFSVESRKE